MGERYLGERVYLKLLDEAEIDDRYVSWFQDPRLMKTFSSTKRTYDRAFLVDQLRHAKETGSEFFYGIYMQEDDALIGSFRIYDIHKINNTCDVAIVIGDHRYHGKGLAVDAFEVANHLVFDVHDIRKITSGMYPTNLASYKALMKAGWLCEGRRIGHYLVDGEPMDQLMVSCFNPRYFDVEKLKRELKHFEL